MLATFAVLVAVTGIALMFIVALIKRVLYVCQPNEVMIFSGRRRISAGRSVGYRIVKGGRAYRWPIIETVDQMDLTNMIIEVAVQGAYSRGGIPLTVQGVANIKVPGEEPLIHNTLQRFLGKSRDEIMRIARETLEGNLRGVLAILTPEQVNQDKEAFADKLTEEAEHDLTRLGLVLDTLKIQNVTDDVGYLDAIGRMRGAQIRRSALVAEAETEAEAAVQKWRNTMQAQLATLESEIVVARKDNERRIADARTKREAMIAEERAAVQADIAQAGAEVQMQAARIEQVRLRLDADVLQPAAAEQRREEESAKAEAASIIEKGRATAKVLTDLAENYRQGGANARDVLLMQKMLPLIDEVSSAMGSLHIDQLTVVGGGTAGDGQALAGKLVNYSEQIKAATGVDVPAMVRDKLGATK